MSLYGLCRARWPNVKLGSGSSGGGSGGSALFWRNMRVDGETTTLLFTFLPRTFGCSCFLLVCTPFEPTFCIKPLAVDVLMCVFENQYKALTLERIYIYIYIMSHFTAVRFWDRITR